MALPAEVKGHQLVWVDVPGGRTRAIRVVADGDRQVAPEDVTLSQVADLIGNTRLGRTAGEVSAALEARRSSRRLLALEGS